MNPFLAAFANTYIDGEKARPDLATTYQATDPVVDQGLFAFGGQAAGQTANDVVAPTPYTPPPAPAPASSVVQSVMQQPQQVAPQAQPTYTGIPQGLFGGGAATANRTPEQLATIKGTWNQYLNGQYTASQIMQMMTQYGVNYADIAAATGKTPQEIQAMVGGRPQGTTASPSGMVSNVGIQPTDDYMNQMNKYYSAYFGGGQPENTMLNSWYNTPYTPPVTGYQKNANATTGSGSTTTPAGVAPNQLTNERSGGNVQNSGMSTTGVGRVTDAIKAEAADTFKKYIGLGIAPAAAITLTKSYLAEKGFMDAVNATDDPFGTWLKAQYDFGPIDTGSTGSNRAPAFGTLGNSSFGEGEY